MHAVLYAAFQALALWLLWTGQKSNAKAQWRKVGVLLLLVFAGTVGISVLLKWMAQSLALFTVATAKQYAIEVSISLLCLWGMAVLIALINVIGTSIKRFHETCNADNWKKVAPAVGGAQPGVMIVARCLLSFASALMLSGLWLR
ncbi:hypothetical protein [Stenotrophomonas sp. YAU14D1_LEIMI4_1]|uniref:hypothetical protein n=1 Tax=Stenotrophomonas sp. YAU14D1_LEIMI4_1 TaxID=2072407 RepID=UPI0019003DC7|nr:hypothetical protein [Stenotrophomonas sp. YAU14D1_LEIMI4_1]